MADRQPVVSNQEFLFQAELSPPMAMTQGYPLAIGIAFLAAGNDLKHIVPLGEKAPCRIKEFDAALFGAR